MKTKERDWQIKEKKKKNFTDYNKRSEGERSRWRPRGND